MDEQRANIARDCLRGAETGSMAFPQIVATLMREGFESYMVDFRRAAATYYLPDGGSIELATHRVGSPVAAAFDAQRMQAAIGEAQRQVPGYTYEGFCEKAVTAGCAGYIVSFAGRRAVYFGRTAETHVERFAD